MNNNPLYLVSTPIGNLEDITYRAVKVLSNVELVACEDTRRTGKLLNYYNIKKKKIVYNDINKEKAANKIIEFLKTKGAVALVSDSGTPSISDPGVYLVRYCLKENITLVPIPGPSSILSALICSGSATDIFSFYGFLPKKKNKKEKKLKEIINFKTTSIIFESPFRLVKTLIQINILSPKRQLVVAREITKIYEEFKHGTASELLSYYGEKKIKGELIIIIKEEK